MITVSNSTSAAELQSIIDAAPAGETIVLGAGHFTFDRTVVIDRDDIAVTGTGSDVTTINLIGNARAGGAFQIGSTIDEPTYGNEFQLAQDAAEGSMYLHLADTTGLRSGRFPVDRDAQYRPVPRLARRHPVARGQAAAHLDGRGCLRSGWDSAAGQRAGLRFRRYRHRQGIDVAENVRLGGFTVNSGLADADPARFQNTVAAFDRANVISMSAAAYTRLFDIEVTERAIERLHLRADDPRRCLQPHRRWGAEQG